MTQERGSYGGHFIALIALSLLCLLPSLIKPPHIDEESYLFIAQAIVDHPFKPYDWWRPWQPFTAPAATSFVYAHPPLFLWSLSMAGGLFGFESIPLLRFSHWLWWLVLVFGVFSLARGLCRRPLEASIAVLLSPGLLLVGHQSLMIDLPTIALMTATMAVLWPALKGRPGAARLLVGGCLLGLATLSKYPALLLWLPILFMVRRASREHRLRPLALIALPWGALFLGWQAYTAFIYGSPHLLYVLLHAQEIARTYALSRGVGALAHLGGTVVAPGLLVLALWRRPRLALGALALGGCALGGLAALNIEGPGVWGSLAEATPSGLSGRLQLLAFFTLGAGCLGLMASRALPFGRDGASLLLWAGVMVLGVILGHNFVGARYLALGSVPLGFLIWGWVEGEAATPRRVALALSVALSLGIAFHDIRWARSWEPLVEEAQERALLMEGGEIYGGGEWTFRYLKDVRGWGDLTLGEPMMGDVIILAPDASPPALPRGAQLRERVDGPDIRFTVHNPKAKVGLYSDAFGFLPYGIAPGPISRLEIWQMPLTDRP